MAVYTTIDDPEAYFQVVTYTGNGAANNAITLPGDTDMQPDFVWIKNRDQADSHCLFDSVRGATKVIPTDTNAAEATDADTLDSFTSDGFQVDADVKVNTNTEAYVAWCWKESATAGFDIVAYTGDGNASRTISHSLSAVPHVMIKKRRASADSNMHMYHHKNTAAPETDYLTVTTSAATDDYADYWDDTAPTSSVFTVDTAGDINGDGDTFIMYLWSEKQGFSKFGTYTGNGNADGAFVYTGFRPAFIMTKRTDSTGDWVILDNKRPGPANPTDLNIATNEASAEIDEGEGVDLLSNGFKHRESGPAFNGSGNTYIFMAFAEAPFVNSKGVPGNAK